MKNIKNIILFIIMSIVFVFCDDKGFENVDWFKEFDFVNFLILSFFGNEVVLVKESEDVNVIIFIWI